MPLRKNFGFTLVELMMTLVVFFIIANMAVPSMRSQMDKREVIAAAEALYSNISLARTEAITRSRNVHIRFNADGSTTWQYGVSQNDLCDLTKTDPTVANANACVLVADDGDGTIDDGTATIDSGDTVLYRFTNSEFDNVAMTLATMPASNQLTFDYKRGISNGTPSISLQSEHGYKMRVIVGLLGQIRLCSPAGNGHVNGYSSDGC
jgi:type IV fimbrial biogenesis protein FimT